MKRWFCHDPVGATFDRPAGFDVFSRVSVKGQAAKGYPYDISHREPMGTTQYMEYKVDDIAATGRPYGCTQWQR